MKRSPQYIGILAALLLVLTLSQCKKDDSTGGNSPAPADSSGIGDTTQNPEFNPTPYAFDRATIVQSIPSFGSVDNTPDDNPTTEEGAELGRYLFYDVRLSENRTISCASCHKQQHAFSDPRKISRGLFGEQTNRHSMALFNMQFSGSFNWDGSSETLEEQMLEPIRDPIEMHMTPEEVAVRLRETERYPPMFAAAFGSEEINPERISFALAQFCRTLVSYNSEYDQAYRQYPDMLNNYDTAQYRQLYQAQKAQGATGMLTPKEYYGLELFRIHPDYTDQLNPVRGADCMHCHENASGLFTTNTTLLNEFANNGLQSEFPEDKGREEVTGKRSDRGKFKIPTLRNIGFTAPYMHDGRFETLAEVIEHYDQHVQPGPHQNDHMVTTGNVRPGKLDLTEKEKEALLAFLKTLNDTSFTENSEFSNPFD